MTLVSDDLKALSMNSQISESLKHVLFEKSKQNAFTTIALKSSRNSFFVADAIQHISIPRLYERSGVQLKNTVINNSNDDDVIIPLNVVSEQHRKLLKTGKVYLHEKDIYQFIANTSYNGTYSLSLSVPLSLAEKKGYPIHPFFDLDRKSDIEILVNDECRQLFCNAWHSFLCKQLNQIDIKTIVSQGLYSTSGIHIQVYGCSVSVSKLRKLWIAADAKLGEWLMRNFQLKVDTLLTAAFIPGCSKTGNYIDAYKNFNDSDEYYFPFCLRNCHCKHFNEKSSSTSKHDGNKYSIENIVMRVYSRNKQILDIWRRERKNLFETAEMLVNKKVKRKSHSRLYNHKHVAILIIALAYRTFIENWNKSFFKQLQQNLRHNTHFNSNNDLNEIEFVGNQELRLNNKLDCNSVLVHNNKLLHQNHKTRNIELFDKNDFVRDDEFARNGELSLNNKLVGNNELIDNNELTSNNKLSSQDQSSSLSKQLNHINELKIKNFGNDEYFSKRTIYDNVGSNSNCNVNKDIIINDDSEELKENLVTKTNNEYSIRNCKYVNQTFYDDEFVTENSIARIACRYIVEHVILVEIESDLNLNNFRSFVAENFDKYFETLTVAIDQKSPTYIEIIYALLHVAFWIGQECGEMGSFTVNNEAITKCERLYDIIARYCEEWFKEKEEGEQVDKPTSSLNRKLAKVKQRGEFTLSLISPYDGTCFWSFSSTPSWTVERFEDCYKENILTPNFELCKSASHVKLYLTDKKTTLTFKSTIKSCLHFVQQTWKRVNKIAVLPPNLLVCSNGKIFNKQNGEEFLQLPCFRFDHVLRTGIDEDIFQTIRLCWQQILCSYDDIDYHWFHGANNGEHFKLRIENVARNAVSADISLQNSENAIESKCDNKLLKHLDLKQFVRGCELLLELFSKRDRLWYIVDLLVDILMNNERKKVVFCYSPEANHGKSTFSKVISLLFNHACASVAFSAICSDNESEAKNPAVVQAAGKTVVIVDELPGCASSISSPRSTQISPYFLKLLTSNSETNGVRNLNHNSKTLYFYSAAFIFANDLPDFSVFSEAEVARMHFVKFEHCYAEPGVYGKRAKRDLSQIIVDMKVALEYLIIARASSNLCTVNVDPKSSIDYKNVYYESKDTIVKRFYAGLSECDKFPQDHQKLYDKLEDFVKCKHPNHFTSLEDIKRLFKTYFDKKRYDPGNSV